MKENYQKVDYIFKEVIKVDNFIENLNQKIKVKTTYSLSGETTLKLLGLSSIIFKRILVDVGDKNSDKNKGIVLEKRFKRAGIENVYVDKVKKKQTITKDTITLTCSEGKVIIPTYEKLLVNLDTYGLLPDEKDRVYRSLVKKVNYDKVQKIVSYNRNNHLKISEDAREFLSKKRKPEKKNTQWKGTKNNRWCYHSVEKQ